MYGYMGRILRVNLSECNVREEPLSADICRKYLGGRGLAAYYLFKELKGGIDPLGPENKLIFATGPLELTYVAGCSRYGVFAKSPLTGIWGESHAAGRFGNMLKASGFDLIIVEGISPTPVYLAVKDGCAEIKDASHIWGKFTGETEDIIKKDIESEEVSVACIGPAGEKLVKYACIVSDKHRVAGRTGMGAVMGSKKLKAVAVVGHEKPLIANEEKLAEIRKKVTERAIAYGAYSGLTQYGTSSFLNSLNYMGLLPIRNFQANTTEEAEKISGEAMKKFVKGKTTCPGCPIQCIKLVAIESGEYSPVSAEYGAPEYETIAALGSLCENYNFESIAKANMLCNMYGIDTISTGVSIAFAIECYEKGIITSNDTNGMKLKWGDSNCILQLIEKIANKESIGQILSEGVKKASEIIGRGAEKYAMHVKGLELPLHEPRGRKGMGLSYAVSNRGACHLQADVDTVFEKENAEPELGIKTPVSRYDTSRTKVEYIVKTQNKRALADSAIICKYVLNSISTADLKDLINATTGWGVSLDDLMTIGDRIINLCRCFNIREGIDKKDDLLPTRFEDPLPQGPSKGQTLSLKTLNLMLNDFYDIRGWSIETGIPTNETLKKLDLHFAIEELKKIGKLL